MSSFRTGFWCRDLRDKVHRAGCWRCRWIVAQEIHIVQDIASTSGLARSLLGVAPWLARCQEDKHAAVREFWQAIQRGQAEAFAQGPEAVPTLTAPHHAPSNPSA